MAERNPTGAQQKPRGGQEEPKRSPRGAQEEAKKRQRGAHEEPRGGQEEAKRSPRETQENVYGAPRLKIQVPDVRKKRVLERWNVSGEPKRSPRGAESKPRGAQEEAKRSPNTVQEEVFWRPEAESTGPRARPTKTFVKNESRSV